MINRYIVTDAGQLIDKVETKNLETCKQYLIKSGYTEDDVNNFSYRIKDGKKSIYIPFNREFETSMKLFKYSWVKPGTLFFTVEQFKNVGVKSHLMVKLNEEFYMIIDLGIEGQIDSVIDIYPVMKNAVDKRVDKEVENNNKGKEKTDNIFAQMAKKVKL